MENEIIIPTEVETALSLLINSGFEAYMVGGCVRDILLNKIPHDWDITTSAKPEAISSIFKGYNTVNTGLKHGTVTVIINHMPIEITTFRIDGEYVDNRRPEQVYFTESLEADLKRRDFTINAMAMNKENIIDLFGGIDDLDNKQIKCVGNPDERFKEDGLRILRAMRFSSMLNFSIEEITSRDIHKNKELLVNISSERIISEFKQLIVGPNFYNSLLNYRDVIEVFIPEINKVDQETYLATLGMMSKVPSDLILRLSSYLLMLKTHETIENLNELLRRQKYDNDTIKNVILLIENIDRHIIPDAIDLKFLLNTLGEITSKQLIILKIAQAQVTSTDIEDLNECLNILSQITKTNQCYSLKDLAINGSDLMSIGISKGKIIGQMLDSLLEKVIMEELENKKETLLNFVIKNFEITVDKAK